MCSVYSNTKQKKIIKLHYNNVMEHILSGVQPKSVVFLKTQNWNGINVELKYKVYVVFTFQSVAYLKCLRKAWKPRKEQTKNCNLEFVTFTFTNAKRSYLKL